eukprot:jgi/Mesen1/3334/ME000191S02470
MAVHQQAGLGRWLENLKGSVCTALHGDAGDSSGTTKGASSSSSPARVVTGIEAMAADGFKLLQGRKVGIITNATGVLQDMRHIVDVLHAATCVEVVAVLGPEHGFCGAAQAGASEGFHIDPKTRLPVYDTYRKSGKALAALMAKAGADTWLFDIQDVGVRFYTYIWTLYDCLVAAALCSPPVRLIVADRPNPIGGVVFDGPTLDTHLASFVGRKSADPAPPGIAFLLQPIVMRHGMTAGELAQLFNGEYVPSDSGGKQADLTVVKMDKWRREMLFEDTGLLWVGAPWADHRLAHAVQLTASPGCIFREAYFQPSFSKHAGHMCAGIQVHVVDTESFNPLRAAVTVVKAFQQLYPKKFSWRCDNGQYWIDTLTGTSRVRTAIDSGASVDEVIALWQDDLTWFGSMRIKYLLYPG